MRRMLNEIFVYEKNSAVWQYWKVKAMTHAVLSRPVSLHFVVWL